MPENRCRALPWALNAYCRTINPWGEVKSGVATQASLPLWGGIKGGGRSEPTIPVDSFKNTNHLSDPHPGPPHKGEGDGKVNSSDRWYRTMFLLHLSLSRLLPEWQDLKNRNYHHPTQPTQAMALSRQDFPHLRQYHVAALPAPLAGSLACVLCVPCLG